MSSMKAGLYRLFKKHPHYGMSLFLIVITLLPFWEVSHHEFLDYDDDLYVTGNRQVQAGLSWEGALWAFTTVHASNWHPMTWLSHMLDVQLYGLNPSGHHLTNVLLHVTNVLLLFCVLWRMTHGMWQSALVAGLFGIHPLHVESVVWVAERKDVLSTMFGLLALRAYAGYVERPGICRYLLVVSALGFGLLTKPMLVTLPFVLLLLDYWPLKRLSLWNVRMVWKRVWEKVPLLALAGASGVVTYLAQERGGAMRSFESFPMWMRIENTLVSYAGYIGKMLWPSSLAVFYPHPKDTLLVWQIAGAAALLLGLSVWAVCAARRRPYLVVGWLWYLGTLVPVIGIVQIGLQGMADRYTYVPMIGLFIMLSWGASDFTANWRYRRMVLAASSGIALLVLIVLTGIQVGYWRNSITLYEHALRVTSNNFVMHTNLGVALAEQGRLEEAITHYTQALAIRPEFAWGHEYLGDALAKQGKLEEAITHYTQALVIRPEFAEAHNDLGIALAKQGKLEEAITHYTQALAIKPEFAEAHNSLGVTLAEQGKLEEAITHYTQALAIKPEFAEAHNNLGAAVFKQNKYEESVAHFSRSLRIKPNQPDVHYNLGLAYQELGRIEDAAREFQMFRFLLNEARSAK
jgi:Flp pilus assembly protein TadD